MKVRLTSGEYVLSPPPRTSIRCFYNGISKRLDFLVFSDKDDKP